MAEVQNRITGTEMEWPAQVINQQNRSATRLDPQNLSGSVIKFLDKNGIAYIGNTCTARVFLQNGALWYNDPTSFREYATPVDDSFAGTTSNEMVGEQFTRSALDVYEDTHQGTTILNKRVVDLDNNVWGYHENYCVDAKKVGINQASLALLGIHMATRNILFGAGMLTKTGDFKVGQKTQGIKTDFSRATTNNRPMINLRQEELADGTRFNRVHIISGDANMSPWATRMKLGTTSLVLRLIEYGRELEHLRFQQELHEVGSQVSSNYPGGKHIELRNGGMVLPSGVQRFLMKACKQLAREVILPEEEMWTLQEWDKATADLQQNYRLLEDRADWPMKLAILERQRDNHGWSWNSDKMHGIDRKWDEISPNGIGIKLRQTLWSRHMPSKQLLQERMQQVSPPEGTRSRIIGAFVDEFHREPESAVAVNWDSVKYSSTTIKLGNPSINFDTRVNQLIKEHQAKRRKKAA